MTTTEITGEAFEELATEIARLAEPLERAAPGGRRLVSLMMAHLCLNNGMEPAVCEDGWARGPLCPFWCEGHLLDTELDSPDNPGEHWASGWHRNAEGWLATPSERVDVVAHLVQDSDGLAPRVDLSVLEHRGQVRVPRAPLHLPLDEASKLRDALTGLLGMSSAGAS